MRVLRGIQLFGAILLVISALGCNKRPYQTVKVQGTVTYKGQPVPQGEISFNPVQGEGSGIRRMAVGTLNEQGEYVLSSFDPQDGAIPGEYKVVIKTREKRNIHEATEAEIAAMKWYAPRIYADPEKSPLKATVPADASQPLKIDFALEGDLP